MRESVKTEVSSELMYIRRKHIDIRWPLKVKVEFQQFWSQISQNRTW